MCCSQDASSCDARQSSASTPTTALTAFDLLSDLFRPTFFSSPPQQHTRQKKKNFPKALYICTCCEASWPHNTNMENTRVFVGGLPPSCSNDQLRNHFASRFQVTDAHVLPKRRMGFVGFKSNEIAKQAVEYFNRTYMKMSKISVDLARPVRENLCCQFSLLSLPAFTLTRSVGLETDQYYCRLITSLQRRLIPHANVMHPMTLRGMRSSVKEMPTPRLRILSSRSILLWCRTLPRPEHGRMMTTWRTRQNNLLRPLTNRPRTTV